VTHSGPSLCIARHGVLMSPTGLLEGLRQVKQESDNQGTTVRLILPLPKESGSSKRE
jgi:hypothetical protein